MLSQIDTIRQQQAERLELIREQTGMIQSDFAKYLDLEPGSYSDIKRGKNGISKAVLKKLEKKLNVNIEWLLNGIGLMLIENNSESGRSYEALLAPFQNKSTEGLNGLIDRLFKIIERRDNQIDKLLQRDQEEKANIAKIMNIVEKLSAKTNNDE